MRSNKMEIASTLHTKGPREGTRELSHTDSPGTGTGASHGASPSFSAQCEAQKNNDHKQIYLQF